MRQSIKEGLELINKLDNLIERWKPIEGYDNYSVSTFGRVRNNDTNRILKPIVNQDEYLHVNLYKDDQRESIRIHRLVAQAFLSNPLNKTIVDHINRNPKNNHFKNLRFATSSENSHNRTINKNNKSGVKGICWHKTNKKWRAKIVLQNKHIHVGYFDNIEDAKTAIEQRRQELHGEFASNG